MKTSRETIRTIDLGYDQLLILDGGRDGRVRVLFGATWLTEEGEAGDAVLRGGTELPLHGGRTVIQGLEPTRLEVVERGRRGNGRPAAWMRQLWGGVRRAILRLQMGPIKLRPRGS